MKILNVLLYILPLLCSSLTAAPTSQLLIDNLNKPVQLIAPSSSDKFFYILEKEGLIKIYDRKNKSLLPSPFLDIRKKIKIKMNEQGLLGMAFSPSFDKDNRFYLYYTDIKGNTVIARYNAISIIEADQRSEEIILTQVQDYKNHNGGWLDFGPDGMLYIALGDGGRANDIKHRAQDLRTLLGKLLRIDVSVKSGYAVPHDNPYYGSNKYRAEILSYGLRNPWRCSWDKNNLFIADVGQNVWEEINIVEHKDLFGANFGWPQMEGSHRTKNPPAKIDHKGKIILPAYEYKHDGKSTGGFSVTGGAIYKGSVKQLQGRYVFADYVIPHIWSAVYKDSKLIDLKHHKKDFTHNNKEITKVAAFATDPQGEMYIISHLGSIHKIID